MDCVISQDVINQLVDEDILIPVVAIVGGLLFGMVAVISGVLTKVSVTRQRETTKRELAAYVAEGSLEPDKAIALMNAGRTNFDFDAKT